MIKSFVIEDKDGRFHSFKVKDETANFLECESHKFEDITLKKSEITPRPTLKGLRTKALGAYCDEVQIVEVTRNEKELKFSSLTEKEIAIITAIFTLRYKAQYIRGDWTPGHDEEKHYPTFDYSGGFVCIGTRCEQGTSQTDRFQYLGIFLCFPTGQMALEFGQTNVRPFTK